MASTFSLDHAYDVAPATLLATLTDVDYIRRKLVACGFDEVAATQTGDVLEIRRSTEPPLPGFAKSVLGGTQRVVETQTWTGGPSPRGEFTASAAGTPVTIRGTFAIEPVGDASVLRIRGAVEARVPLVGSRIAGLVAGQAARTLEDEYAFTRSWLAGH